MQISWKGQACFHITAVPAKGEQVKMVIDPYDNSLGLKFPAMEADVALVTHDHYDHNNVKGLKGDPFVISNPGEYDVKGAVIQGIPSFHDDSKGAERGLNTMYTIEIEGMKLCHMGDFGQAELTPEQVERIGNIDILMIPVGGVYTIDAAAAGKVLNQIEPRVVIPMHYALPKLKQKLEKLDELFKVIGVKKPEPQQKLTIRSRDISAEGASLVVLEP